MKEYIGMIMFNSVLFDTEYVRIFAIDIETANDILTDHVYNLELDDDKDVEMFEVVELKDIEEI